MFFVINFDDPNLRENGYAGAIPLSGNEVFMIIDETVLTVFPDLH